MITPFIFVAANLTFSSAFVLDISQAEKDFFILLMFPHPFSFFLQRYDESISF
jgi:hypothetical protein